MFSFLQTQQTVVSDGDVGELTDVVELSDGSPSRERERYMPSLEENHLAKELLRCKSIPAEAPISPLPQIQWDLFEKTIDKFKTAYGLSNSLCYFLGRSIKAK